MVFEDEVDVLGARKHCAAKSVNGNAFRPFFLDPLDFGKQRMRLDPHPQDDLILLDQSSHRLTHDAGLRGDKAEQQRQQAKDSPRGHNPPVNIGSGLRSKPLNAQ
jgi:hypothetical protein